MKEVKFTQYLRPNGRQETVYIERPDDVAERAAEIMARGYRFECEVLTTGLISLTVGDDEGDYAFQVCQNGPDVPLAVDKLIMEFKTGRDHRSVDE